MRCVVVERSEGEAKFDLVKSHVAMLAEHFDSVLILCTTHTGEQTASFHY
jgi:hypothetical protein